MSRYLHDPGKEHWQAVKWILRYILDTLDVGLVFQQDDKDGQLVIWTNDDQLLVTCLLLQKHQSVGSPSYSQQWLCLLQRQSIWQLQKL